MRLCRGVGGLAALAVALLLTAGAEAGGKKKPSKNPAATPSPRLSLQPDPGWLKRHEGFVTIAN